MRTAIAVGAAAVLLAIALAVMAPATLLDARIAALSGGRMRIANASGTLWKGSGELVLMPVGTRRPLSWRLDAWPLLRGDIRGVVAGDGQSGQEATIAYARDRFQLAGLDLSLPAESLLRAAAAARTPLGVGGNLVLHVDHLVQVPEALDAQLTVQWRDASVAATPAGARISLGDVRLDLNGRGVELSGPIGNTGGDVEITGQVAVGAAGASKLDATVRPRVSDRERAEMLAAALSALGTADGHGGYRVSWAGTWR
jgi:general secretion pathway protein N